MTKISPNIAELRIKTKTIRKKNLKTKNKNLKNLNLNKHQFKKLSRNFKRMFILYSVHQCLKFASPYHLSASTSGRIRIRQNNWTDPDPQHGCLLTLESPKNLTLNLLYRRNNSSFNSLFSWKDSENRDRIAILSSTGRTTRVH